ncbi:sulfate transporter CysZ [Vibrio sp. S4M6]|uniref:sulfate transporter CysZ n=1 Tax=Vibrio sinus TaxID=2946865 RepID=UPI00202AB1F5|nr:sulfate transporter CysZ [Vibrio sinus]MCL9782837.1 sulfate transporter CysZ [Vibrio sinus]
MTTIQKKRTGFGYFLYGLKIAQQPGIRKFVLLPLLANILLVGGSLYYLFSHLSTWIDGLLGQLPSYFEWLSYLLWPLLAITILATFSYFFSTLANFIAAPFNGLLAEKVEEKLTGEQVNDDSIMKVIKDVPRVLAREWKKLLYVIPKAIGLFILLLIPALGQTLGPILWFVFSSWMLAVQYCDYPYDNHKISFNQMKVDLKSKKGKVYGYGFLVAFFTSIPIVNLFIVPVAICGATAMWVAEFKD